MKVGIVGGTGNMSTHIVNELLNQGHEVVCFNRGISGALPEGVRLVKGDRNDREQFEKAAQHEKLDAAIDLMSYTPEDAASSLKAFRGVKHFIYTSTVVTYDNNYRWFPVTEDHPQASPVWYGQSKIAAERLLLEAHYREKFPVTILRPSTTYGYKRVVRQIAVESSWVDRILKGKPVLMLGDGKAIHHFLHVKDAAKGYAGVLGKEHCIGQAYNLVNPRPTNWINYYQTAMKILGKEVELVGVPTQILTAINAEKFWFAEGIFQNNCFFSAAKIQRDVPEFQPTISLEEGLKDVLTYLIENNLIENSDTITWEDEIIEAMRKVKNIQI